MESYKKYGKENFSKEILERDITDRTILLEREIYWIAEYSSMDRSIGYNLTVGGDGAVGRVYTDEQKLAVSKLHKSRPSLNKGRRRSDEQRLSMRGPRGPYGPHKKRKMSTDEIQHQLTLLKNLSLFNL